MFCSHVARMNPFSRRISMESKESLDPLRIGFLRLRGVVFDQARLPDLIHELHSSRMTCKDTTVNIWGYEGWQRRSEWD
jgi:hypothetical protein